MYDKVKDICYQEYLDLQKLGFKVVSRHDHTDEQIERLLKTDDCIQHIDADYIYVRVYYNDGRTPLVTLFDSDR